MLTRNAHFIILCGVNPSTSQSKPWLVGAYKKDLRSSEFLALKQTFMWFLHDETG